jgi:hypothetical protein
VAVIGQVRLRNRGYQLERIGAAPRQRFGGQRQQWPQRERSAQFRVDKFDRAHGRQSLPLSSKTIWQQLIGDKSALISVLPVVVQS